MNVFALFLRQLFLALAILVCICLGNLLTNSFPRLILSLLPFSLERSVCDYYRRTEIETRYKPISLSRASRSFGRYYFACRDWQASAEKQGCSDRYGVECSIRGNYRSQLSLRCAECSQEETQNRKTALNLGRTARLFLLLKTIVWSISHDYTSCYRSIAGSAQ